MRYLLISYVANTEERMLFGNLIRDFNEYPSLKEIDNLVRADYNDKIYSITILNILEFSREDFTRFTNKTNT